jgi:hypothetical protein
MTFYEIIDGLIDAGDEVPAVKRNGDGYAAARKLIHDELASPHDVEVACYHEAGHWAVAVASADQLEADGSLFEVCGPRIKYYYPVDGKPERYEATPTGLKMVGMENWLPKSGSDVKIMARIAMAGGESVQHFYGPNQKRGDVNDTGRFDELCRNTRLRLGGVIEAPYIYREKALEEIQTDFRNVMFASNVSERAERVKQERFGPVFGFHTKETL